MLLCTAGGVPKSMWRTCSRGMGGVVQVTDAAEMGAAEVGSAKTVDAGASEGDGMNMSVWCPFETF